MQVTKCFKRFLCICLCLIQMAVICAIGVPPAEAAETKTLLVAQAQRMALSSSSDITKKYNNILLKKMEYVEAVEGIKAKVKNLRSFRYTPLLSFKFPEQLNLVEEYELNIKPLTLQVEINTLQHELENMEYTVLEQVNIAYMDVYVLQEKVNFTQEMLDSAQAELERNQARLVLGQADQNDVDTMEKSVETLTSDLAQQMRNFETAKSELTDLVGIDVTTGYTFKNPMMTADIPREVLEELTEYTLEHDQTYYEAKMQEATALLNLDSYESLMRNQYGSKMDAVSVYVNMARNGQDVDSAAFKMKYDEMLTEVDRPWSFKIRILFFTFSMEWFKGEISGTRYIEDEMYALYTASLEYLAAREDLESAEESLRKEVSSSYEALVTARNAYLSLENTLQSTREDLERVTALNKLGKAEYSEVKDKQEDYQSIQLETIDALATYNELLFGFDRLTCGAVTKYMQGESISTDAGEGGDSFADVDEINEPYYYIYTSVEDKVFVFGVDIPEDYEPEISAYEIWYEGTQIGERTPVGEELRHLALDYGETNTLTVRLYDDDTYVDECEIDTTVPRDVLNLSGVTQTETVADRAVGTYKITTNSTLGTSELSLEFNAGEGIRYYNVIDEDGNRIYSETPIEATDSLTYLTFLATDLSTLNIILYDRNRQELFTGWFDLTTQSVMVAPEA